MYSDVVTRMEGADPMSTADNKAVVRRSIEESVRGNLDAIDELYAADFIDHNPFPGQAPDRAGLKQSQAMVRASWADQHTTIEDQIAEGDRVVSRVTNTARHVGDFLGVPATGKMATVAAVFIDRVVDGQIVETWTSMDMLDLLQQLGVESSALTAND
jgi:steroid delta-isomerase-like uncharacterized protein